MRSTSLFLIAVASPLLGCSQVSTDGPLVVVRASYPGAGAQPISDMVAAPIELQIDGVEGMTRIESESLSDGSYVARVQFGPKSDAKVVATLVQNRVALAQPVLPELVTLRGIEVKVEAAPPRDNKSVVIALLDRGEQGRAALREWSQAVLKRLTMDGLLVNPEVFPGPDEEFAILLEVDRKSCDRLGVVEGDVREALKKIGGWQAALDVLKKQTVTSAPGKQVSLAEVTSYKVESVPSAVCRVDLWPSARLRGSPPAGKTPAEVAARCIEIAEAERKKKKLPDSFAALSLTD